ncbi:MAG: chemotaxis-specific protein-glutamate methyltransferase CheB [Hungatella sp.]|jgi:two-component system chemotaxis response regulator CheB|nr:chemotaxis-specific protein-glutamate methyltransferase CheB [Hungatella sp.]
MQERKIKVLVIDDSVLYRKIISKGIIQDPMIEVAAVAEDSVSALRAVLENPPDVITCDVEMPGMSGIDFVRRMLSGCFIPIIMVSSVSNTVFEAMEAGAVDFVVKPDISFSGGRTAFIQNLIKKIRIASTIRKKNPVQNTAGSSFIQTISSSDGVIAIGASTGGMEAIRSILNHIAPPFSSDTLPGILIAQHIPPFFSKMFADRLSSVTFLHVKEAETGDAVVPNQVLICPGGHNMRLVKNGEAIQVECFSSEVADDSCPSVDILFHSVAEVSGQQAIGILLSGMGFDGAQGLLAIRKNGGRTIGQNKESSVVYGMAKVAFEIGAVEQLADLDDIPEILAKLLTGTE